MQNSVKCLAAMPQRSEKFQFGTGFLQNPGIPGFFMTGLAQYFYPGIFSEIVQYYQSQVQKLGI